VPSVLREKGERFMFHRSLLPRSADVGCGGVFRLGFREFVVDCGSKKSEAAAGKWEGSLGSFYWSLRSKANERKMFK
jgi:hypothetical protein